MIQNQGIPSDGQPNAQDTANNYMFNGKKYGSLEDAQVAKQSYDKDRFLAFAADYYSVGGDRDKLNSLYASNSGLSQMSNAEKDFIVDRYAKSNPYDRKAYDPSSIVDQYLSSVGLPSSKELNNYRKAYYNYASGGGIKDNYASFASDPDAIKWMQEQWKKDTAVGINGDIVTTDGKAIKYGDTLLDDELKANGLMPSDQVEKYYQQYQTYLSTNKQIENFNAAVDDLVRKDGVSAEDAFSEVINRPEYQNLVQYWAEPTAMPEETAQKYQKTAADGFSTYTDLDSYNADQKKAAAANAKRNAMDFRVSVADYKQYQARRAENERWVAETEKYRRIQDNATKWMVAPATTAEEKKEQKAAIDTYINAFGGNPEAVANMQWYFDLVNHGVPADIAITGNAETIGEWSSANVSDPKEWASLYLAAHGYTKEDGAYYFIADAVETTRKTSTSADFAATAEFDPRLLTKGANFTPANGVTLSSAADAAYAVINGVSGVRLNKSVDTGSEEYATYAAVLSGDAYKQMTDEERGTFNTLFRKSNSGAMNYLYRLSFVLQDRAHATNTPNLASGMSEEDIANQIYDQLYYLEELNYRATPGTFNSRMAEAMNRYQGMSDEELEAYAEKLLLDVSMTPPSSPDINEKIDAYEADYDNAIRVLNRRKQMREQAKVLASLSGYTDEDGASATKTVNQTVKDRTPEASSLEWGSNYADPSEPDALQKSKYAKIVNNAYQDYSAVHFGSGDSAYMTHVLINRQGETEHEVSFEMTSEQKNKFNWLLLNKGEDAADAYYEAIRSGLEDKSAARLRDEWYGWANDSGLARFGASALSSLALPATGLSSLGGTLLNAITGTKTTKAQATRWDLTGGLRDAVQEDFSDAGKFWYGTGMSTVDSGLAALLNVATESNIGEIMLASGAYASTLRTALDRGLDSDRATATALAAGIVEIITEHVGLETLVNGIKSLGSGASKGVWKEFIINTAKQTLFEGSEEAAADILNLAADGIINGDMSEFDQNVSNYIQAGYTKSEAQSLAWRDFTKQTLLSFAGGAISGGFMAGVGGGFKAGVKYVNDKAFAPIPGQEKVQNTSAVISTTPADVPVSAEHFTQYEKGKGIVNSIFGDDIASGVEKAVGSKSVSDERITSVLQGIDNLNNTDYLYQYTHDSEGNLSISDDERVALATALASLEQSVDASKVDAAFIKAMASQQTAEQRGNNANPRNIVSSQKLREYRNNIDNYRSAINNKVGDVQTRLATAQSRVDALNAQKQIAYENGDMETYYELTKPNGALSAALEELGKWQSKLDAINNGSDMEIRQNRQQIERMQSLIDGHFASLADAIDRYAPASFDNGEIARANAKERIDTLGAQIDAMLGSDILSDETVEEQRGILSEQMAELRSELKRIDARINSADPTALSRLMTSAKNGTVGDFIAEQDDLRRSDAGTTRNVSQTEAGSREASLEALAESAESANTEQAGESTAAQTNAEDLGVESVKQGDTNEQEQNQKNRKETPKVVVNIGKTIQQRFDRIAKKFGLEIVWTSREEIDGNGMYNRKEPNKIYLATDMLSPTGIAKEMVVAREFFTHEVVHYVANTKAYQRLSLYALQYYTQRDGEEAVNRALNGILDEERAHGKNAGPAYAAEEMTALFAQEVLFSGESGNKNALTWLTRTDGKYVSSMLTWLQYLIKRGNVRRMKDGAAIKTLLLDAEYTLSRALKERKMLDAAGLTSAFQSKSQDEQAAHSRGNTFGDYEKLSEAEKYDAMKYNLSAAEIAEGKKYYLTVEETARAKKLSVSLEWMMRQKYKKQGLTNEDFAIMKRKGITPEQWSAAKKQRSDNGYEKYSDGKTPLPDQFAKWDRNPTNRNRNNLNERFFLGELSHDFDRYCPYPDECFYYGNKAIAEMNPQSVHYHPEITVGILSRLDEITKDPMIVFHSKSLPNRVCAFGNLFTEEGHPLMVAIEPNERVEGKPVGQQIYASCVKSIYVIDDLEGYLGDKNIKIRHVNKEKIQEWIKRSSGSSRFHLMAVLESAPSISSSDNSVKPPKQTSGSDSLQDLKGIADHDAKHSRGMNFSDYANAGESGKYEPIDWSKNKILQADGTPYPVLYSGSKSVGHTVFNPEYADDGLTTWLTNSIGVAQSYAREKSDSPLAPEFFPLFHDKRKRIGTLASYYDTNSKDNNALYDLLNKQARGDFSMLVDEIEYYSKVDPDVISEWGDVAFDIQFGLDEAASLLLMIERIATNHSELDENNFYDLFYSFSDIVDSLEEDAYNDVVLQRGMIDSQDYYNGNVKHDGESVSFHVSELARFRTAVEDAIVDSDIFDVLRKSDRSKKHLLGFDSMYKGNASLFSDEEASSRLPIYSEKNGIYKLRPYGENPLIIETSGAWNMIDLNQMPEPVQKRLARLYGWAIGYSTRDIARAAFEQGYDSVVYRDIVDIGRAGNDAIFSDVIATFNPYQQKSIYNTNPTTNPDIMHSRGMTMDDYIARYGQKPQNAFGQANNIRTAERVDDDKGRTYRVSDAAQTLKQVPTIRQNVRDAIDDGIIGQADGLFDRRGLVYEPVTLDRMREMGSDYIAEHGGLDQSMKDLTRDMPDARSSELTKYMSAANQVFTEIGSQGVFDPQAYYEFVASYVEMRSNWGRVGRAMQLVNDSPLGRQVYWERVVQRMNEKNREATDKGLNRLFYRGGYQDIVIPQALYANLAAAQTQEEINAAQYAITEYIGMHSPLTVSEALRNWRYFSMLANPVTHMRNMLGNVAMQGGVIAKDAIASGLENIAVRAGWMDANDRTHSVVFAQDPATRQYIEDLYQENAAAIQSGGRDGFKQQISDAKPKAPFRWLSQAMSFNTNMLEREDALFLHMTFNKAAAQYMQARGIDANNITRQQRADIVQYATQQAQEATYRDASKLADALNQFAKSGWMQQLVVESVMPFKKTPINIAKRGLSYSPLGLARSLVHLAQNVVSTSRGGDLRVSATKLCDELAQGITGTMLSALGFLLSRLGILKLSAGNGDKDKTFASDIGHQSYSLEIGDVSIKIEQLAPLTFPLFMGAALEHAAFGEEDGLTVSDMADAALSIADPLMDMSFMSSLNSALETYDSSGVMGVFENMLTSYAGQYLPTIGSKVNSFVNRTRRTTKGSQASPIGAGGDYTLRSYASKVPGLNQAVLEPYVKTTGEYDTKDFGKYLLSFMNNFVSPVNVQIMDTTPVNTELERLVQATGQSDFVPQNPKKYLTIGNSRYNMTAKEYTEYSKEHNETVYASLSAAIGSSAYANATDDQRVQILEKAYNRAHKAIMDKYKIVFNQK